MTLYPPCNPNNPTHHPTHNPPTTQVVQFLKSDDYAHFDRIVFDTAPTGHTLRLLTLPDFLDKGLGKLVRLRAKLAGAAGAVKSLFTGQAQEEDAAVRKMNDLRVSEGVDMLAAGGLGVGELVGMRSVGLPEGVAEA